MHAELPFDHDPLWDSLAEAGAPVIASIGYWASAGIAYHLLWDAGIEPAAYHGFLLAQFMPSRTDDSCRLGNNPEQATLLLLGLGLAGLGACGGVDNSVIRCFGLFERSLVKGRCQVRATIALGRFCKAIHQAEGLSVIIWMVWRLNSVTGPFSGHQVEGRHKFES